jgi:hypothetical protein
MVNHMFHTLNTFSAQTCIEFDRGEQWTLQGLLKLILCEDATWLAHERYRIRRVGPGLFYCEAQEGVTRKQEWSTTKRDEKECQLHGTNSYLQKVFQISGCKLLHRRWIASNPSERIPAETRNGTVPKQLIVN